MSSLDYLDLCRLCLVKDRVSVPIFEGEGDVRQIFLKIAACLPVKVAREDKLPKKICDDCVYKVELFYQFWNTTANAEKQLLQWLGEVGMDGKQGYVTNTLNQNVMKQEQSAENRLDGSVMQQVSEHQNNMGMGMMDNMGLGIPMMMPSANQQQITSVPMDTSGNSVQTVQAVPGPSSQTTHNQISQSQTSSTQQEEEEESSEDEENSDEECDGDEGLPVKEESEEDPNSRTIEPTTFVNVSLACDEAGPSGLQQQKISDIPEMPMQQPADGDPKSGVLGIVGVDTDSKLYVVGGMKLVRIQLPLSTPEDQIDVKEEQFHVVEEHDYARSSKKKTVQSLDCSKRRRARKNRSKIKKEPKKFACSVCNVDFERHGDYKRHMVKHSDQRPYKCEVCEKAFKRPAEMSCHMDLHRGIEYLCELCNFTTINKVSLSTHKRRMHKRDFRYHCDKCNRSFMSNYDLQDHKASHLGTKTFICEHCGNAYSQRTYLVAHKRFVHRIQQGAPKKFHCNLCSKSFATDHNLRKHISLHSQTFLCAHCGKEFATKHDLKLHTRKHTGERPYQCKVCSKAFARSVTLRVHSLTHTGERPYVCDICDQSFTQRSSMMAHRRKHPGDHPRPPPLLLSKLDSNEHSS